MALLVFSTTLSLSSLSPPFSSLSPLSTHSLRVQNRFVKPTLFNGLQSNAPFLLKQRTCVVVKASETDTTGSGDVPSPPANEVTVPVENLPLESKQKLIQEQRLKMKLAKKIRLRRKRLVRKRHLRKKGRWPPSKMKKNKNV